MDGSMFDTVQINGTLNFKTLEACWEGSLGRCDSVPVYLLFLESFSCVP